MPNPAAEELSHAARRIAHEGGNLLMRYYDKLESHQIAQKDDGLRDLLTVADTECEEMVIRRIREAYPGHGVLGEESGYLKGSEPYLWIIDPLDGTTNFARAFPLFGVSIGVLHEGRPLAGAVEVPTLGESFWGGRGVGAFLNERRLKVSTKPTIPHSILATGFSYNRNEVTRNNVDNFSNLILKAHDIRRPGAASVDLCYVAAGRFDGYWEMYLKPWDVAAGALLVEEAGGKVSSMTGGGYQEWLWNEQLVATNGLIHAELMAELSSPEAGYRPKFAGFCF